MTVHASDPACWRGDRIGRAGLERPLSPNGIAALADAASRVADRPVKAITRADFDDPSIRALGAEMRGVLASGRGAILLTGLDLGDLPAGAFERIYWGIGTHLGQGAIQGPLDDVIARVEKADNPTARGTLSDIELAPHTDMHELMALAAVSLPEAGGVSHLVSAAALHDALAARAPEHLPALYEGYWAGINPAVGGLKPISDTKVPVFSVRGGRLSCCYNRYFMRTAAEHRGEPLPAALDAALAALDAASAEEGLALPFVIQPGEMLFWHNWACLHARTAFRNGPGRQRLLLRLWLNANDRRPVHPAVAERARTMDADHHAAVRRQARQAVA